MATQTQSRTNTSETLFEQAAERVRDLNERVFEASRKAGATYLDSYEKTLQGVAAYEEKVAEISRVEWFSTLLTAQAGLTRDIAKASVAPARELLK